MESRKITKSNALINSSYRLSLNELRIVLFGLSHINPYDVDFPLFHRINVRELADFFDIGEKDRGSFYDNIKEALINKFWEREFSYFDEDLGEVVKRRWLIEVRYGAKNGTLAYHYNPMIKSQLQQLANRFTSYFLKNVSPMKSAYAVRLYEISVMYLNASGKNKTTFTKTIKSLKEQLDIAEKYDRFHNFKAKVLEIAKRDIDKHSDIRFNYQVIKLGRSANEIEFTITKKNRGKLLVETPERLTLNTLEQAKELINQASNRFDIYTIEQQFYEFIKSKGAPKNIDSAFIGFVKKKIASMS